MIRYERLLVAVDGSDAARAAAGHALGLAAATGASVEVLHVAEPGGSDEGADAVGRGESHEDRGRRVLADIEALAATTDVEVTTHLGEGVPEEAIGDHARDLGSHLVAMGRRGRKPRSEGGGVTERVLRSGALPVLTARTDGDGGGLVGAGDVLLPTDGSEPAERAAEHAASVAALAEARVHVVAVVDAGGDAADSERAANLEERHRRATERLATAVESSAGVPVETAIRRGRPAEELAAYAGEAGVDAVVMGASGRSGVERVLLGSVTEALLGRLEVPMLVVPGRG